MALPSQEQASKENQATELVPIDIIRTETVLSKLPIHTLAKKGRVNIHITTKNEQGKMTLNWKVSPNLEIGEPRQLAYKIDSLVVNRRIHELGRPLPKIIKLGSIRKIGEEIGRPPSLTKPITNAIKQNAGVLIDATIDYVGKDGAERHLEAVFTRYSVIFTGKKLPGGAKADAVYLILNDPYWEVLSNAPDRPLDYAYLKALAPAPQRFYELISYRIFAAIKYKLAEARMLYSEYCTYAAQQRYYDYDHTKKQMYKVHRPHLKSGYLEHVRYEKRVDEQGRLDWEMFYAPGQKAVAEFKAFNKKRADTAESLEEGRGKMVRPNQPAEEALALTRYFQKTFFGVEDGAPSPKEIAQAAGLIQKHGVEKAQYVVEFCHKMAPETKFKPQVFGAVLQYADRAIAEYANARAHKEAQAAIAACIQCDSSGFITITDAEGRYLARKCSHELPRAAEKAQGSAGRGRFTFSPRTQLRNL